ncbi:MAG: hypothetical protein Q9160_008112 [Pyrenula sp. 1 TL-2023]
MSSDEVSRLFMPRKSIQRTNSSSSVASSSSSSSNSTVSSLPQQTPNNSVSNGEAEGWAVKKKGTRGIWPSSKSEVGSASSSSRQQGLPTGPSASSPSTVSANHQSSAVLPSQHVLQPQANGIRSVNGVTHEDSPAVLALLPLNGTFERKQINVPFRPEILRIGRQTNAKTVPTSHNGFFDSKVLSRQHAEIWAENNGKIFIRDVKSSNGTFVNGQRLSPENRESEPRELREGDTLELGIDIVSEDQKTVVHHKVSAKVEFAGIYGAASNILDLNFGDIDPTTGASLLSPLNQGGGRGRLSSNPMNGRVPTPQSASSGHINAAQQKGLVGHEIKIGVDHLFKILANEMKQAKMSNQSLAHTGDFLHSILSPEQEKEKPFASGYESNASKQSNNRPKIPKIDPISRFSDPPAPPPQQPLPEKPDAARSSPSDIHQQSILQRTNADRSKSGASTSPTSVQSGNILSLVEALKVAQKQIDAQGTRVQELEGLLLQERNAREDAEERIRHYEKDQPASSTSTNVNTNIQPDSPEKSFTQEPSQELSETIASEQSRPWAEVNGSTAGSKADTDKIQTSLQEKLDLMKAEVEEMKQQMERCRGRAESAETEASSSRASLAKMIEKYRLENAAAGQGAVDKSTQGIPSQAGLRRNSKNSLSASEPDPIVTESGASSAPDDQLGQKLEHAITSVLQEHNKADRLAQSAPYASMLGVVLIGVGLMAYLNSWQKVER